ncbi:hypothetical protein SDC9_184181 [bioreactor metagenome]|uniref:Uncharacterized protein n=1 Tax=bioreactor metagenome TaxID=1076179 RepID=A0A645HCB5_9ZZZZ
MFGDDALRLDRRHFYVCDLFLAALEDFDDRLELADADTACLSDGDCAGKTFFGDFLYERIENGARTGGNAAGCHADDDTNVVNSLAKRNFILHFLSDCRKLLQ